MRKNTSHDHHTEPTPTTTSRSSPSCSACKLLKRRCGPTCIFAPYFRADEPKKFARVHKVFGASNVSKLLAELPEEHRQDAVNSLSYEAEARLRDPVYGCLGPIALLHRRLVELQHDVALARARVARCTALHAASNCNACISGIATMNNDYCYDYKHDGNNDNDDDHIQVPILSQSEGSQLGSGGACIVTTDHDFGQVPILPL